jgi:tryptophan-rich sensory protein
MKGKPYHVPVYKPQPSNHMKYKIGLVVVCFLLTALVSPIFITDLGVGIGLIIAGTMFVTLSTLAVMIFNYLEEGSVLGQYKSKCACGHTHWSGKK